MHAKKILLLLTITVLNGCQHQQASFDSNTTEPQIAHNAVEIKEQDHIGSLNNKQSNIRKELGPLEDSIAINNSSSNNKKTTAGSITSVEKDKRDLTPPVVDLWQPNEAQIARGQDLIDGLCEEINHAPSMQEIERRLQTHMGLSKTQAQKVIAALELPRDQS